jgi:lysophospholipase L1-like esterase
MVSSKELTQNNNIVAVVVALGINDLKESMSAPATQVYVNKAIDTVQECYPEAKVYLSGITPRKGNTKTIINCNARAAEVNQYMREYAKANTAIHYINNSDVFNPKKVQIQHMYTKEANGVHLTALGKNRLMTNITEQVRNVQQHSTPASRKRGRSGTGTPPSAEKDPKHANMAS